MFDSLKSLGAIASLAKKKDAIAEAVQRVQNNLDQRTINVASPDKAVAIVTNAKLKVLSVTLDPAMLTRAGTDAATREKLQGLIAGAMNAAQARAADILKDEILREANDLGIGDLVSQSPELQKLMGRK
jgi:DNA-binding protein YbaB